MQREQDRNKELTLAGVLHILTRRRRAYIALRNAGSSFFSVDFVWKKMPQICFALIYFFIYESLDRYGFVQNSFIPSLALRHRADG